ncbi:MAG: hypothetical protein WBA57_01505 [Elainellaceae cyanobacterium]
MNELPTDKKFTKFFLEAIAGFWILDWGFWIGGDTGYAQASQRSLHEFVEKGDRWILDWGFWILE